MMVVVDAAVYICKLYPGVPVFKNDETRSALCEQLLISGRARKI